jgi:hypothetical protein
MRYTVEVCSDGSIFWYKHGTTVVHREGGPAIEYTNGDKEWWYDGYLHREDGPAIKKADGVCYWFAHGKRHRDDGPAIEYSNGDKRWYLYDKEYSEEEFKKNKAEAKNTCSGKVVEIDGKKYKLVEV